MAATRLLRTFKPMTIHSSSSSSFLPPKTLRCSSKAGSLSGEKRLGGKNDNHERKQMMVVKASMATSDTMSITLKPQVNRGRLAELVSLLIKTNRALLILLRTALKPKPSRQQVQMFIERGIIDCRFFTLLAVSGSLLGSVLCFVEGCFMVLESYFQYFHALSHKTDQGHMVHLLIEAIGNCSRSLSSLSSLSAHYIYPTLTYPKTNNSCFFILSTDMFLVGTAMLIFGVGLYAMFVGSKAVKEKGPRFSESNFFGLFYMKAPPAWVDMKSVSQAKSKIGHAVVMILQVGLLDKFKSIPLVTPLDLACFAGAVLLSSAGTFILARLSTTSGAFAGVQHGT
ncbi:PREDICTED: uncharacterized protein LOC103320792 isoform X1 [Prunus mume]|uniref:Uncharacterized protein LOC103320792 isoform X1 n=1 Tax=Prunus mume TaxID=102107 RepID=A0ABM1LKH7_PRUMU|nr:PREDICTED: uncharacterized protein LOC103320792 isoform X1 [Prunus mume]